jgi:hypothetical protein
MYSPKIVLDYLGRSNVEKGGRRWFKEGDVTMKVKSGKCYASGFEEGRSGHEPRGAVASRSWKRRGNRFDPSSSTCSSPANTWVESIETRVRRLTQKHKILLLSQFYNYGILYFTVYKAFLIHYLHLFPITTIKYLRQAIYEEK